MQYDSQVFYGKYVKHKVVKLVREIKVLIFIVVRVTSLSEMCLVGRWEYGDIIVQQMKMWIDSVWTYELSYAPKMCLLLNNWLCFYFMAREDIEKILR